MADATSGPDNLTGVTPDSGLKVADSNQGGPMLAADGTTLKSSLNRALRRQNISTSFWMASPQVGCLSSPTMTTPWKRQTMSGERMPPRQMDVPSDYTKRPAFILPSLALTLSALSFKRSAKRAW